jgi:hypothetical protein
MVVGSVQIITQQRVAADEFDSFLECRILAHGS